MEKIISLLATMISVTILSAQSDKNLHLTTGVGINKIQGELGKTFRNSVAFNSGFEKSFSNSWFGVLEVNFNTIKYDQQFRDESSPYLFQNTSSSLITIGINGGYDFHFGKSGVFASPYTGTGYVNVGEPRVYLDEINNIITQQIVRKNGIIWKAGGRVGLITKSKLLQTIYLDGSWWTSSAKSHGNRFESVSVFIGLRMKMN